jgi:hypothetical protein
MHFEAPMAEHYPEPVDPLFTGLDHREIADGAGGWIAEVVGIHRDPRETWVQIATSETFDDTVLLHLSPWAGIDDALDALRAWSSRDTSRRPRIIEVMRQM